MKKKSLNLIFYIALVSLLVSAVFLTIKGYNAITGAVTGVAKVEVLCLITLSLPVSSVDFGQVAQGTTLNTTSNNPAPLKVQNDGQMRADVSISRDSSSSALFNGTGGGDNSSSFQFKIDKTNESNSFNWSQSLTSWTNVPGTEGIKAISGLKYSDTDDSAEIDLKIKVPNDEPSGLKNEALLFTASPSDGAECNDEDVTARDANCLNFDLDLTRITEVDVQCDEDKLVKIGVENICPHNIILTKVRVSWINDSGEKIERVQFKNSESWNYYCTWGCSPIGKQPSGTLLDFGSRDYTLLPYSEKTIKYIEFDSNMKGKTFKIELTLSDNSIKSIGYF